MEIGRVIGQSRKGSSPTVTAPAQLLFGEKQSGTVITGLGPLLEKGIHMQICETFPPRCFGLNPGSYRARRLFDRARCTDSLVASKQSNGEVSSVPSVDYGQTSRACRARVRACSRQRSHTRYLGEYHGRKHAVQTQWTDGTG